MRGLSSREPFLHIWAHCGTWKFSRGILRVIELRSRSSLVVTMSEAFSAPLVIKPANWSIWMAHSAYKLRQTEMIWFLLHFAVVSIQTEYPMRIFLLTSWFILRIAYCSRLILILLKSDRAIPCSIVSLPGHWRKPYHFLGLIAQYFIV